MRNPKVEAEAREIVSSLTDETYLSIARDTEASITRQRDTACNDVIACVAWDSFADGCEAYDVPCSLETFAEYFPVFAELVR